MAPYKARSAPSRTVINIVRHPWVWLAFFLFVSVYYNIKGLRKLPKVEVVEKQMPVRTPLDNFQNLHSQPLVNGALMKTAIPQLKHSENAIVTSLYNDAYAVAIATLGHSLNKVNTTARRIVFYLPGKVSEQALCVASATGFEPHAVQRIDPPGGGEGVHSHFADQFTKLSIWNFDALGIKALVYLDADMIARRNFDELFLLPFNFAAVPDVYIDDRGYTVAFNAGVLFVRPSADTFRELVLKTSQADFPHWEAEQAYLNIFYGAQALRLPYVYGGNIAIKRRDRKLWDAMQAEMRVIHYSLVKPFWRDTYDEIGIDKMHENVQIRMKDWDGAFKEEMLEWGELWKEAEAKHGYDFMRCSWKPAHAKPT